MNRFVKPAFFFLIAFAVTAAFTLGAHASTQTGVVSAKSCLKMRSGSSYYANVMQCLPSGSTVQILGPAKRGYSLVQITDKNGRTRRGYVHNKYIQTQKATNNGTTQVAAQEQPYQQSETFRMLEEKGFLGTTAKTFPTPDDLMDGMDPGVGVEERTTVTAPKKVAEATQLTARNPGHNMEGHSSMEAEEAVQPTRNRRTLPEGMSRLGGAPELTRGIQPQSGGAPEKTFKGLGGEDVSSLTFEVAKSVGTDDIGLRQGFSLTRAPGWAKLNADGSISGVTGKSSHCTSATYAGFLKTIGTLAKRGAINLTPQARAALNSPLFRDAWNSNGSTINLLYEKLGGETFTNASEAQKGDFVKIDRKNGTGHTVYLSRITSSQICYWSSNRATQGPGEQCESRSSISKLHFSRITSLAGLQNGLNKLATTLKTEPILASVRSKGGNGYVPPNALNRVAEASRPASIAGANRHVASSQGTR